MWTTTKSYHRLNNKVTAGSWLTDTHVQTATAAGIAYMIENNLVSAYTGPVYYKALQDIPNLSVTTGSWLTDTHVQTATAAGIAYMIENDLVSAYTGPPNLVDN